MKIKNLIICFSIIVLAIGYSSLVHAGRSTGKLGVWGSDWNEFQNDNVNSGNGEDWVERGGFVDPGTGGQAFDAEYLFYKIEGNTLHLGLQTGFNIISGKVSSNYWTGDIALKFNGSTNYTHAVDFGLETRDNDGDLVEADSNSDGKDAAGLYSNVAWNNDVIPAHANDTIPFAMDGGTIVEGFGVDNNKSGSGDLLNSRNRWDTTYYRKVSFDIGQFRQNGLLSVNAHWTMSCGNDAINGSFSDQQPVPAVPEPGTIALLGIGLAGLAGVGARRRLKFKAVDKS